MIFGSLVLVMELLLFESNSVYTDPSHGGFGPGLDQLARDNFESVMNRAYGDGGTISWNGNEANILRVQN